MRRRMVETSIAHDKRLNGLSDFGQLVYLRSIPHLDDFGRLEADPETFKAIIDPLSKKRVDSYDQAMQEVAEAGLWVIYKTDRDRRILQVNKTAFERINKFLIKKRPKEGVHEYPPYIALYKVIYGDIHGISDKDKEEDKEKDTGKRKPIFPHKALLKD